MLNFRLLQRTKVLCETGAVKQLPELLELAGYHKPFLVFDKGIANTPIIPCITKILEAASVPYITYNKITPDPTADLIDEGAKLCLTQKCDCIIAIGGGSVMDAAKGIGVMCHNEGSILDYVGREELIAPSSSLICIPTTSGTGSELSNWIVVTDLKEGEKHPINVINSMCTYAILDPELVMDLPPSITAATGLDVFSHAFEAYTSLNANIATDLICEKIMETVIKWLPVAVRDGHNIKAREHMMIAASYGGWMLVDGLVHIGHCLAHEIGAAFHIPHGAACAYAFPPMIRHIKNVSTEKILYTGRLLGAKIGEQDSPEQIAEKTCEAYVHFRDQIVGLAPIESYHPDLTKVNITMAEHILSDPITSLTPEKVTLTDVMAMLYSIFIKE